MKVRKSKILQTVISFDKIITHHVDVFCFSALVRCPGFTAFCVTAQTFSNPVRRKRFRAIRNSLFSFCTDAHITIALTMILRLSRTY